LIKNVFEEETIYKDRKRNSPQDQAKRINGERKKVEPIGIHSMTQQKFNPDFVVKPSSGDEDSVCIGKEFCFYNPF
jgi:hypothetical protein